MAYKGCIPPSQSTPYLEGQRDLVSYYMGYKGLLTYSLSPPDPPSIPLITWYVLSTSFFKLTTTKSSSFHIIFHSPFPKKQPSSGNFHSLLHGARYPSPALHISNTLTPIQKKWFIVPRDDTRMTFPILLWG